MSQLREQVQYLPQEYVAAGVSEIDRLTKTAQEYVDSTKGVIVDGFQSLKPEELRSLAYRILGCKNVDAAYTLLAESSESGQSYYDLMIGPQHQRPREILSAAFKLCELYKVDSGLDVGAGTGASSMLLADYCRNITVTDINLAMLQIAARKMNKLKGNRIIKGYKAIISDATDLPFADNSYDIVTDHGIVAYLTSDEFYGYMKQVYRILKPGGRYYEYQIKNPDPAVYKSSPRAELVGAIVSCVLSFSHIEQLRNQLSQPNSIKQIGFTPEHIEVTGGLHREQVLRFVKN